MKPVVYTAENCHQCQLVKDFVENSNIDTDVKNVDIQNEIPPKEIFIYPALFIDNELVAYGEDIIRYYKSKLI